MANEFNSPSQAAMALLARPANGPSRSLPGIRSLSRPAALALGLGFCSVFLHGRQLLL
jgi:hypothetical protein